MSQERWPEKMQRLNAARVAFEKSDSELCVLMKQHDILSEKLRIAYREYVFDESSNTEMSNEPSNETSSATGLKGSMINDGHDISLDSIRRSQAQPGSGHSRIIELEQAIVNIYRWTGSKRCAKECKRVLADVANRCHPNAPHERPATI